MESGEYIKDFHSLEELNNVLVHTGESMANIEENVSGYINGVKDILDRQLNAIREQLETAQQVLCEAEAELQSCEASQEWDEEDECYHPSCSCEMSAVSSARREVEDWQRKYDRGKEIVEECQREIDDYNSPGGLLSPPGGHCLIENMCDSQTPKAVEELRIILEKLRNINSIDVGGNEPISEIISNPNVKESDKARTKEERFSAFKGAIERAKQEQSVSSEYNHVQDANRAMRCPDCGRPFQLCICRNVHRDVNLYH